MAVAQRTPTPEGTRPARRATPRRARLRSPGQLWGRRTILIGLAFIALALFGALLVLAEDDNGDQSAAMDAVEAQGGELSESLDDAKSGISVRWPSEWRRLEKGGVFAFQSPDKTVLIAISAPEDVAGADQLRKDAIAATSEGYGDPAVRPGKGRTIGGLETAGAVISGKGPSGQSTTLVAVAEGETRAYLVELYTAAKAPDATLVDAQLTLNSVELSK
jgi:hypothetical protein